MDKKRIRAIIAAVIIAAVGIGAVVISVTKENKSADVPKQTEQASEKIADDENKDAQQSESAKTGDDSDAAAASEANGDSTNTGTKAQQADEKKVDPTFMYFVDDETEKSTAETIDALKKKYPNVVFDIKNVDKDKTLLENFSLVDGNIPALIMLDTSNNICDFKFKCADEAELSSSIDKALGK